VSISALLDADFKTTPWRHQADEFEESCDAEYRAFLWQMRSGKTKIVIDTACHLYKHGKIDTLIIFAPNGVHENWVVRELPTHAWVSVPYVAKYWRTRVAGRKGGNRLSKAEKAAWERVYESWWADLRAALTAPELLIVTVNSESMTRPDVRKIVATLLRKRKAMVVWDESSDFRTPGSSRTKMSRSLVRYAPYRRILDGTASHNSPLHLFSQYELLRKSALGFDTYEDFKDRYAVYEEARGPGGRKYPRLKHYQNLEELKSRMAPMSSVVLREDCSDMPAVVQRPVSYEMTPEQVEVYRDVMERIKFEIEEEEVPIKKQVILIGKLQQVVSGFVIDSNSVVHDIPGGNPRMEVLAEEVFLSSGPCIIWCQFHEDMDRLMTRLKGLDIGDVREYSGRVSPEAKLEARTLFQTGAIKALVGHPKAGGRGLELSAASKIIWYSHTFDAIMRAQADERATKMGGGNVDLVDLVATVPVWLDSQGSGGVDQYILNKVTNKVSIADDVAGRGLKAILQGVRI
jgi:hypothetical protein